MNTPPIPLELICFGPPTVRVDGRDPLPEVLWRPHLALLIYLALSPDQRRTREHLVGVFWGERPQARARGNLSAAVHRLRNALGDARLRSELDTLVLSRVSLEVDVWRLEGGASGVPDETASLIRGDFLEGLNLEGAPAFDAWVSQERRRCRALAATSLVALGEKQLAQQRLSEAADAGRRALGLARHSEPAVRLVMRAAALAGDATSALAAFHDFASRLKDETAEEPPPTLLALAERMRRQSSGWMGVSSRGEGQPPLVGRRRVHEDAFTTVRAAFAGGPRTLVITGVPGMGRTRLLSECAERFVLDGALVMFARPLEADHDAPWSTLRRLLHDGLAGAPGLASANTDALSVLAHFAPDLAERFSPREPRDVADVAAALVGALDAVSEEKPLMLALDDAHWCDGSSLAALHGALAALQDAPLVLALTVATGVDDPPYELLALQSEVGRALPGTSVRLQPLVEDDLRALVAAEASWCTDPEDHERLTRRLMRETSGSPLFAVTLLRALEQATTLRADLVQWPPPAGTSDAPFPFSVPSLLRHGLAVRITQLTADERTVLCAASVCGQALDAEIIADVAEQSEAAVVHALPAFERRALVAFDGQRYAFVAPLVAEVVRAECLTKGERRRLERRAVKALASRTDLDTRAQRAELSARVEPGATSFTEALAVARDALDAGAHRIARRMLRVAEGAAGVRTVDETALRDLRTRVLMSRRS